MHYVQCSSLTMLYVQGSSLTMLYVQCSSLTMLYVQGRQMERNRSSVTLYSNRKFDIKNINPDKVDKPSDKWKVQNIS